MTPLEAMTTPSASQAKRELRQALRAARKALPPEERARASHAVCAALIARNLRDPVAIYNAMDGELDLAEFIAWAHAHGVRLVEPRQEGGDWRLAPVGRHDPMPPRAIATWLVPGVGFTLAGDRLGFGGGYYDKWLSDCDGHVEVERCRKIGVCFKCQLMEALPVEPHDIRLDEIIFA